MSKLRKFTQEELNKIIENHQHWLREDCKGWEDMKADLSYVDLRDADLSYANLSYADLRYADFRYANLNYANLYNAKINYLLACPSKGSFTAWKKAGNKIVKLQILEDSKRLSATTNKCRCDKALVLEIQDLEGNRLDIESVRSDYDGNFVYKVGEIAEVDNFDENRWNECSTGIHFFVDRQMAVDY